MKCISLTVSLFFMFTSLMAQNVETVFLKANIIKLKNAKGYTLKVAGLMPEEIYSYQPSKEEMSFGKQLLHISENLCWLSSSYLTSNKNPLTAADSKLTSKNEIINVVTKAYDFAINTLENFDAKSLTDSVKFFSGPMNKLQIIDLVQDHQTHHRGQILVYLRLNNIQPPDYVGW